MIHRSIFKRDSKGKLRVWYMEQEGSKHRTYSGLMDGALVVTDWTQCQMTNEGRANQRSATEQASFEIEAQYKKKLSGEYHESIDATDDGAHFFMPMLAEKYETFEPGFAQPKLDGIRCIAKVDGLWSRKGKPLPGAPHVFEQLAPLFEANPDLVLDGELYNHDLKDDFNEIASLVKKQNPSPERLAEIEAMVEYHVYDLPSFIAPFSERYNQLCSLLAGISYARSVFPVDTVEIPTKDAYDRVHGTCIAAGYEGSMHRLDAIYENKRTKSLKKRKSKQDAEFKLLRVERGLGNWSNAAKRAVCQLPDGREFGAGIKGSMKRGVELLSEHHEIVTVEFFEYTPDGIPRFPIATKFHGTEKI
jgi:ATP-dependent DNA ligase